MIEVNNIYKSHKGKNVLNGVSLTAEDGEVFGIVGSNGAGKTTLLDIIANVTREDIGYITINGRDLRTVANIPNLVGYVQDKFAIYPYLTAREYLKFLCTASMLTKSVTESRIKYLSELFSLENDLDVRVSKYSKGMKKRLSIASALLGNPKVLVMDEPTASLDTEVRLELVKIFEKIKQSGKIVILSTNSLWDIENYCDRVAYITKGRITFQADVVDIKEKIRFGYEIRGELDNLKQISEKLSAMHIFDIEGYDFNLIVYPREQMELSTITDIVSGLGIPYYSVNNYRPEFKDVFFKEANS